MTPTLDLIWIISDNPGTSRTKRCLDPGWKFFDGPSTDDRWSKNIVTPDPTRQHYGWTWKTPDHQGSATDHPRPNTVSRWITPDHPGWDTDCPGPPQTQHGLPRTIPDQKYFCINRAAFLFLSHSSCWHRVVRILLKDWREDIIRCHKSGMNRVWSGVVQGEPWRCHVQQDMPDRPGSARCHYVFSLSQHGRYTDRPGLKKIVPNRHGWPRQF